VNPLSEADLNVIFYTLFLLLGLPISYKYAKFTVSHTGMVLPHFFVSLMLNLCIGTVGIVGWIFFSVKISRAFTIGGIYLGAWIISISLMALLVLLLVKRKSMIQRFHYHYGR
jgi:ABC-type sulfate transport system permease component